MENVPEVCRGKVATREGGVDRNISTCAAVNKSVTSPPARVAWIEMYDPARTELLEESRHPRGWRG